MKINQSLSVLELFFLLEILKALYPETPLFKVSSFSLCCMFIYVYTLFLVDFAWWVAYVLSCLCVCCLLVLDLFCAFNCWV